MAGARKLAGVQRTQGPALYYISGQYLTTPNDTALTIPSTADSIWISTEGGVCYYGINAGVAGASSPGHIADGSLVKIGPIANLTGVRVHSAAGNVHVQYWREA